MSDKSLALQTPLAESTNALSYRILDRDVTMPVVVRDASVAMATYVVPKVSAQRLIPGDDFEVAEIWPGRALFSLGAIDYRDNDLGDYNEVSMLFFVRPRGEQSGVRYLGSMLDMLRGRLGTYIYRLPVNQKFTCVAGSQIWGFPKTVEEIDIEYAAESVRCTLWMDGTEVLTLRAKRGGKRSVPETEQTSFTHIDGAPHRTKMLQRGRGVGFSLGGGAQLTLGRHPVADELRSLGLPKRPLMTMWMANMHGVFSAAEPI